MHAVFISPFAPSHLGTVSRLTRWMPHLERLGCSVDLLTACTDEEMAGFGHGDPWGDHRFFQACLQNQWRNIRRAGQADVVMIQRGLLPLSPWQRPTFEKALARHNPRLVFDFYDAIWPQRQDANRQASRLARWLHPARKIEDIIQVARVVTVANERLKSWADDQHPDVRVIPMLFESSEVPPARRSSRGPVVLGWFGSEDNLSRLMKIAPALQTLAATRDIRVQVVSSVEVAIPGVSVDSRTHPWSPESESKDLSDIDVGLLPLDDSVEDRGKSPYKLLQYFSAGVPVVATPLAMDLDIVRPGEAFLPALEVDDWVSTLTRLVDQPEERAQLGERGRAVVTNHYSFESHAQRMLDVLRTAAGR
jgi:glycosyltransferase involved in cell wall biosynthesis